MWSSVNRDVREERWDDALDMMMTMGESRRDETKLPLPEGKESGLVSISSDLIVR